MKIALNHVQDLTDAHKREGQARDRSVPNSSFDYCFTTAGDAEVEEGKLSCLIMIDSQTGSISVAPTDRKDNFKWLAG